MNVNKKLIEYFNLFYKLNKDNNNINDEELILNNIEDIDYSSEIQKWNDNKNNFKFNYFTSQEMHDLEINTQNDIILLSEILFEINNINSFIHDLINPNNKINNDANNDINNDLKKIIYDNINMDFDTFAIKNCEGKALIQVNINLNTNGELENDNFFYDNIKCYLLISNKEINNYCELDKKLISYGNLWLYNVFPWDQINVLNYSNLYFKVILFNHYK